MAGTQTEKPAPNLDEIEAALGVRPELASGGQIENFRNGWAVPIMSDGNSAHFYRRNGFDHAIALCGKKVESRWLYGAGNYPRCKTCQRIADRQSVKG